MLYSFIFVKCNFLGFGRKYKFKNEKMLPRVILVEKKVDP